MSKKLNVILDIDETFVQYVGLDDWEDMAADKKAKYQIDGKGGDGLFILRPHFDEFFQFLGETCKTVNLWTWSDAVYAAGVKSMIERRVPGVKISNVWVDDDVEASIELHGNNKDLNYIWYEKNKFNPCDTILVDDLPKNTQNSSNIKNGIQIAPFHPLGEKEKVSKTKIRTGEYHELSEDDVLVKVMEKLKEVMSNPGFCSEGDMPKPFTGSTKVGGKRRKTFRRKQNKRKTSRR